MKHGTEGIISISSKGIGYVAIGGEKDKRDPEIDFRHLNTAMHGDVVEIILDRKRKKPSRDWLEFVVTRTARHEIVKAIKH